MRARILELTLENQYQKITDRSILKINIKFLTARIDYIENFLPQTVDTVRARE